MSLESEHLRNFLDGFYGSHCERTRNQIQLYCKLYDLPRIERTWDVDPEYFGYCKSVKNFVVVALYNQDNEILVIDTPSCRLNMPGTAGSVRLLGGPIVDQGAQSVEETVNRIVLNHFSVNVVESAPVAYVENCFRCGNEQIVQHGLGFIARCHGKLSTKRFSDYRFTAEAPDRMVFSNAQIFSAAAEKIGQKRFSPPVAEIEAAVRPWLVRVFHHSVFRRLLKPVSNALRVHLYKYIDRPRSVLDASCGDDPTILSIAESAGAEFVVANDISRAQMASLRSEARARRTNIIFTNHNIAHTSFAVVFDVTILKNTLHHIASKEELLATLRRLWELSSRLIIVEIEEPRRRWSARLFNRYYELFLGDGADDHHFFTVEEFETLNRLAFGDMADIRFDHLATLRGLYMVAVVDRPNV